MPIAFTVIVTSDRYGTDSSDFARERELLQDFPDIEVELIGEPGRSEEHLIAMGQRADALMLSTRDPVSRRVCESIPRVKVIARYGVGLDNVDLQAAADHGIVITHYPQYCTSEVADHALAMILTMNRRIAELNQDLHDGAWGTQGRQTARILRGPLNAMFANTVGVVGLGRIGEAVTARLVPFGSRILIHDPYIDPDAIRRAGAEPASFDGLIQESDIVTLHCPLTPETRGLLGPEQFAKMKPTVAIVNTCRGPVVNEAALIEFLTSNPQARAALDVTEIEPLDPDSSLYALPNVILTPHAAYFSEQAVRTVREQTFLSAIAVLRGERPPTIANPAVLERVALA
ncbi:MAG: C-terminal binding protein [Chloroflexia bacterium]|nr:C-terminal binding protein [Chloroflexia bacterium]